MSVSRDILFEAEGRLGRVVVALNQTLLPEAPLAIETISSPWGSWEIATGKWRGYGIVLKDGDYLEFDDPALTGFGWHLKIVCRIKGEESEEAFKARCDADAGEVMGSIGAALRVRCVLLRNLQSPFARYP